MKLTPFLIALVGFTANMMIHAAEINVYSHRHYDSDKILFTQFTKETGIKVNVVKASADQLIQRLISEGKNSPAVGFPARHRHRAEALHGEHIKDKQT